MATNTFIHLKNDGAPSGADLSLLLVFEAVYAERQISRAAQRLGLAQPTVSLHVSELEARLGVPLLVREPRRVRPTPAGLELVERGRRVLRDVDEAVEAAQRRHAGLEGRVRIGVSSTSIDSSSSRPSTIASAQTAS